MYVKLDENIKILWKLLHEGRKKGLLTVIAEV